MSSTQTKERPILFSGPMVRAILDGRKTVTRRLIKPQPTWMYESLDAEWFAPRCVRRNGDEYPGEAVFGVSDDDHHVVCQYGAVGDRLWVRETHSFSTELIPLVGRCVRDWEYVKRIWYQADNNRPTWAETKWRPSIFMPRHASRITLEVVSARVERLQEITEEDVAKEGFIEWSDPPRVTSKHYGVTKADVWETSPKSAFARVWREINGALSWDANPWVWRVEFKQVQP